VCPQLRYLRTRTSPGPPLGHVGGTTAFARFATADCMTGRPPDLRCLERERATGIEPAFSAWESRREPMVGRWRTRTAGQRLDKRWRTTSDGPERAMRHSADVLVDRRRDPPGAPLNTEEDLGHQSFRRNVACPSRRVFHRHSPISFSRDGAAAQERIYLRGVDRRWRLPAPFHYRETTLDSKLGGVCSLRWFFRDWEPHSQAGRRTCGLSRAH
jgi:hypothetical protein